PLQTLEAALRSPHSFSSPNVLSLAPTGSHQWGLHPGGLRKQELTQAFPSAERRRSRSSSRDRERRRRERSRSRDRDRRRSRSRSPHRRRSRSPRRHRSSSSSPPRLKERRDEEKKEVKDSKGKERQITEEDLQGKTEEEIEMMKMMGFASFDTTKGKKVDGAANAYAINVSQKRKYRQYMNRKGGFNRPLDFIA
uniref:U4/U6.U5 small nuclear ribonucleoprotein 27 kDa protein n=2 Tax=Neoaves TaxID=3078114 RepID=A0A8V5H1I9_MELUD